MLGGRSEVEGKGWRNLYITRACPDVWKGTRQLVYELIILSFSLSLSPSLSLSLSHAVRFVSVSFGLALRSIRFCPRVRSIRTVLPFHLVLTSCSVPFGLCLRSTRFKSSYSVSFGFSYAAAYFRLSLSPAVTLTGKAKASIDTIWA